MGKENKPPVMKKGKRRAEWGKAEGKNEYMRV